MADAALALATCDPERENGLVVRQRLVPRERRNAVTLSRHGRARHRRGKRHRPRDRRGCSAQRGASVVVADVDEAAAMRHDARRSSGNAVAVARRRRRRRRGRARWSQSAVDRFGGLDCACNIAGIAPDAKAVRRSHARRVAAHDRRRPHRRVPLHAARAAPDARAGSRRRDRQHVVGRGRGSRARASRSTPRRSTACSGSPSRPRRSTRARGSA